MYIWGETPQEIQKIKTQEHPKYINEEDLKKLKLKLGVDHMISCPNFKPMEKGGVAS